MKPKPFVGLYHFTVPVSWTLASDAARSRGDLIFARGDLDGAAVLLSTLMISVPWSLRPPGATRSSSVTPGCMALTPTRPSTVAWRKASPDPPESSTKPYLLLGLNHFTLPQTGRSDGSSICGPSNCTGTLGQLGEGFELSSSMTG